MKKIFFLNYKIIKYISYLIICISISNSSYTMSISKLYNKSFALYNAKKFDLAFELGLKALRLAEKKYKTKPIKLLKFYNMVGIMYNEKQDYENAEILFSKAINIIDTYKKNHFLSGEITNNLGITYFNLKKYDLAEKIYKRSIETCKGYNKISQFRLSFPTFNLANLYLEQKKYKLSEELFFKALSIRKNSHSLNLLCSTYSTISELYIRKKDYDKAIKYFYKAFEKDVKFSTPLSYMEKIIQENTINLYKTIESKDKKFYKKGKKVFNQYFNLSNPSVNEVYQLINNKLKNL